MSDLRDELYSLLVPLRRRASDRPARMRRRSDRLSTAGRNDQRAAVVRGSGELGWTQRADRSFEGAFGQPLPTVTSRTRIVIFHASSGALPAGYFGMLTQGFPQLVRVNAEVGSAGSFA